jgi:hypothetical protein
MVWSSSSYQKCHVTEAIGLMAYSNSFISNLDNSIGGVMPLQCSMLIAVDCGGVKPKTIQLLFAVSTLSS